VGLALMVVYDDQNGNGRMDFENEPTPSIDRFLGASEDYVLAFFPAEAQTDSYCAELFGGALSAGYHIMGIERVDPEAHMTCYNGCIDQFCTEDPEHGVELVCDDDAIEQCQFECGSGYDRLFEVPGGFATDISIVISNDPDEIEFPEFS